MKKRAVLFNIFGLFLCPFLLVLIFTAISSLASMYYEYLPSWLDFMIVFFYDLASSVLQISIFFAIGAFAISLSEKKFLHAVIAVIIALFHAGLAPILQFFVRSLFLASITDAYIMQEYWTSDVVASMSGLLKTFIALIVCILTFLFFKLTKRDDDFSRPYIKPKSSVSVSALIIGMALIISSITLFLTDGEYIAENIFSLIIEIIINIATYFSVILGGYAEKRLCNFKELTKKH